VPEQLAVEGAGRGVVEVAGAAAGPGDEGGDAAVQVEDRGFPPALLGRAGPVGVAVEVLAGGDLDGAG
jgi:hypothetical protein